MGNKPIDDPCPTCGRPLEDEDDEIGPYLTAKERVDLQREINVRRAEGLAKVIERAQRKGELR